MAVRQAGVHRHDYESESPVLGSYTCSVVDIVGVREGPRLAVLAGMHVNEVSSIEAARRLPLAVDVEELAGTISVISLLNTPAWDSRERAACPVDGLNINFCFPGDPEGSFSRALAFSLLNEWASDAVCLVDLHGADLCESLIRYSICQMTGVEEFDREALAIAKLFDVDLVVALGESYLAAAGRSVTGRAIRQQHAAFAEAGDGGILDEASVRMHFDGVLRIAQHYAMIPPTPGVAPDRDLPVLTDYRWIASPATGWCEMSVRPGDQVEADGLLGVVRDLESGDEAEIRSPATGTVLWCDTHPAVTEGHFVGGVGF